MCTFLFAVQSRCMLFPTFRRTIQAPSSQGECMDKVGRGPIPISLAGKVGCGSVKPDINYLAEKR